MSTRGLSRLCLGLLLSLPFGAGVAHATIITVTSLADPAVANGQCQFREAMQAATQNVAVDGCPAGNDDKDTVLLPAGTIQLKSPIDVIPPGPSYVQIYIVGRGYLSTTIDSTQMLSGTHMLHPFNNVELFIHSLTMGSTAANPAGRARAIYTENGAVVNISNTRLMNINTGGASSGGCIYNNGSINLFSTALINCRAGFSGGAIANALDASAYLEGVTIDGTKPTGTVNAEHSGGINNSGSLIVRDSTLARLKGTAAGAAISNNEHGFAEIIGSTIAYNHAESETGGAIFNGGVLRLTGSVVVNNSNFAGLEATGPASNCSGFAYQSQGHNMIGTVNGSGNNSCAGFNAAKGDFTGHSTSIPSLLVNAGGVGQVFMPSKSPTMTQYTTEKKMPINDPTGFCGSGDQRWIARGRFPSLSGCDIGAVQQSDALLVVANASSLGFSDQKILERLQALGYRVLPISQNANPENLLGGRSLVVLSASCTPSLLGTKFLNVEQGVVVMNSALLAQMKMTNATANDAGTITAQTQVALASGVSGGEPYTWLAGAGDLNSPMSTSVSQTYGWGRPLTATLDREDTPAVLTSNAGRYTLFRYPTGNWLADGFVNPGPRGFHFAQDGVHGLTPTGLRFFDELLLVSDHP